MPSSPDVVPETRHGPWIWLAEATKKQEKSSIFMKASAPLATAPGEILFGLLASIVAQGI